uniref:Btz domain-containing protein n=1 Tax=Panagrolaimus davidi TaxID=227884 RepID=A0A914P783_9BILA
MNAKNSKSDGNHQRVFKTEEEERSDEYHQEYKPTTVNDLIDELDHPKDPMTKGDQPRAKLVSLLDMSPVEWPESFSILGSALDDPTYYNFGKSAPEKKSLLGSGSRTFSNSNIDVNDPHFQSLVQKQIEMVNKLKKNEENDMQSENPSSSFTTDAAYNNKPSTSKKSSGWAYDDPFSTSENLNDDDKTIFFDSPPSCLLYKGMNSYQPSSSQWPGYDVTTTPGMPYGYIDPYETHYHRRGKYQESRGQNKKRYDNVTRRGGFNSSRNYTERFGKSAPNFGGSYGKSGGGSGSRGRRDIRFSKYASNIDNCDSNEETSSHFDTDLPREFGKKKTAIRKYRKKSDHPTSSRRIGRNNEKFNSSDDYRSSFSHSPSRSRFSSRRSPHRHSRSRSRSPVYGKSNRYC